MSERNYKPGFDNYEQELDRTGNLSDLPMSESEIRELEALQSETQELVLETQDLVDNDAVTQEQVIAIEKDWNALQERFDDIAETIRKNLAEGDKDLPALRKLETGEFKVMQEMVDMMKRGRGIVTGATGSGKSLLLARMAYEAIDAGLIPDGQKIWLAQPKVAPSKTLSEFTASTTGTELGKEIALTVGRAREINKTSADARLQIGTAGYFEHLALRSKEESDADIDLMKDVAMVIVDEIHELRQDQIVLMGLVEKANKARAKAGIEPIKLIACSATLSPNFIPKIQDYIYGQDAEDKQVLNIEGRQFAVEENFLTRQELLSRWDDCVIRILKDKILTDITDTGDIIAFVDGKASITILKNKIQEEFPFLDALEYHGQLDGNDRENVLKPQPGRKRRVIISTDALESGQTIPGVTSVIDTGRAKVNMYDPLTRTAQLTEVRINKYRSKQRWGRAGRTGNGKSFYVGTQEMYEESELNTPIGRERNKDIQSDSEILNNDPTALYLRLIDWGINLEDFEMLESPTEKSIKSAKQDLFLLGAIDKDGKITEDGKKIAKIQLHPIYAKAVVESMKGEESDNCVAEVVAISTLASSGEIFRRSPTEWSIKKIKEERGLPYDKAKQQAYDELLSAQAELKKNFKDNDLGLYLDIMQRCLDTKSNIQQLANEYHLNYHTLIRAVKETRNILTNENDGLLKEDEYEIDESSDIDDSSLIEIEKSKIITLDSNKIKSIKSAFIKGFAPNILKKDVQIRGGKDIGKYYYDSVFNVGNNARIPSQSTIESRGSHEFVVTDRIMQLGMNEDAEGIRLTALTIPITAKDIIDEFPHIIEYKRSDYGPFTSGIEYDSKKDRVVAPHKLVLNTKSGLEESNDKQNDKEDDDDIRFGPRFRSPISRPERSEQIVLVENSVLMKLNPDSEQELINRVLVTKVLVPQEFPEDQPLVSAGRAELVNLLEQNKTKFSEAISILAKFRISSRSNQISMSLEDFYKEKLNESGQRIESFEDIVRLQNEGKIDLTFRLEDFVSEDQQSELEKLYPDSFVAVYGEEKITFEIKYEAIGNSINRIIYVPLDIAMRLKDQPLPLPEGTERSTMGEFAYRIKADSHNGNDIPAFGKTQELVNKFSTTNNRFTFNDVIERLENSLSVSERVQPMRTLSKDKIGEIAALINPQVNFYLPQIDRRSIQYLNLSEPNVSPFGNRLSSSPDFRPSFGQSPFTRRIPSNTIIDPNEGDEDEIDDIVPIETKVEENNDVITVSSQSNRSLPGEILKGYFSISKISEKKGLDKALTLIASEIANGSQKRNELIKPFRERIQRLLIDIDFIEAQELSQDGSTLSKETLRALLNGINTDLDVEKPNMHQIFADLAVYEYLIMNQLNIEITKRVQEEQAKRDEELRIANEKKLAEQLESQRNSEIRSVVNSIENTLNKINNLVIEDPDLRASIDKKTSALKEIIDGDISGSKKVTYEQLGDLKVQLQSLENDISTVTNSRENRIKVEFAKELIRKYKSLSDQDKLKLPFTRFKITTIESGISEYERGVVNQDNINEMSRLMGEVQRSMDLIQVASKVSEVLGKVRSASPTQSALFGEVLRRNISELEEFIEDYQFTEYNPSEITSKVLNVERALKTVVEGKNDEAANLLMQEKILDDVDDVIYKFAMLEPARQNAFNSRLKAQKDEIDSETFYYRADVTSGRLLTDDKIAILSTFIEEMKAEIKRVNEEIVVLDYYFKRDVDSLIKRSSKIIDLGEYKEKFDELSSLFTNYNNSDYKFSNEDESKLISLYRELSSAIDNIERIIVEKKQQQKKEMDVNPRLRFLKTLVEGADTKADVAARLRPLDRTSNLRNEPLIPATATGGFASSINKFLDNSGASMNEDEVTKLIDNAEQFISANPDLAVQYLEFLVKNNLEVDSKIIDAMAGILNGDNVIKMVNVILELSSEKRESLIKLIDNDTSAENTLRAKMKEIADEISANDKLLEDEKYEDDAEYVTGSALDNVKGVKDLLQAIEKLEEIKKRLES